MVVYVYPCLYIEYIRSNTSGGISFFFLLISMNYIRVYWFFRVWLVYKHKAPGRLLDGGCFGQSLHNTLVSLKGLSLWTNVLYNLPAKFITPPG